MVSARLSASLVAKYNAAFPHNSRRDGMSFSTSAQRERAASRMFGLARADNYPDQVRRRLFVAYDANGEWINLLRQQSNLLGRVNQPSHGKH